MCASRQLWYHSMHFGVQNNPPPAAETGMYYCCGWVSVLLLSCIAFLQICTTQGSALLSPYKYEMVLYSRPARFSSPITSHCCDFLSICRAIFRPSLVLLSRPAG